MNFQTRDDTASEAGLTAREVRGALRRRAADEAGASDGVFAGIAALAIGLIMALAFTNAAQPSLADRVTLLSLGLAGAICFWTPLRRHFEERADAAAFALTLALFVVYAMARRAGPEHGWVLRFPLLPDDEFAVSWAARVAVVGALAATPGWIGNLNGWTRAVLAALLVVALLGLGSFTFLRGFYPVGTTEILDPKPLAVALMQVVEYGALALVCGAACAHDGTRRTLLRVLPLAILALWARHQFFPAPPPPEEAE